MQTMDVDIELPTEFLVFPLERELEDDRPILAEGDTRQRCGEVVETLADGMAYLSQTGR